ncbi:Hint domain-containing protein [Roseobacter sp. YSTF-M11]|uniref:Hint domain-containing protein n=1 Tax=Roseobacter insulae TaxID=2859783 RepID=A0A9X1FSF9_9RHOB|nr:Hint domain-containing protein [Roseobacter insulae]MBW4706944.1 Hint domain-containing protein [Roseobacter insulae]
MVAASKLPVQTVREGVDAADMAAAIFGDGVRVETASYTGDIDSAGIYSDGDAISPTATPGDSGVILSTGNAERFTNSSGSSNRSNSTSVNTSGQNNNPQFNASAGTRTYDAAYLDVDFVPDHDQMTIQFVFSSEEYPEFQNSIYQDFVGVWVNGSQVNMDVGNGDVDPGNVNTSNNINMFVDNQNDDYNTEMDGFTITLTLTMNVVPDQVNSIRIGIADVSDHRYDSNLLIAADSIQTELVAVSDNVQVFANGTKTFNVLDNDVNEGPGTLTITHINGQAVTAGDTITLPTGQEVTLNADGTFSVLGDGDAENFNFTYSISNGGNTDVGYVNATSVPCFVAGTMIATAHGNMMVERLKPGDLVITQDDGPQPLRWIGTRTVAAAGAFAPIHIRANTFGKHGHVLVSPLHRILIRDTVAELLFGEAEVLVSAKDLVNDGSVRKREGGSVTYVHLMFDRHQVIFSEGLATESFLPGPQTTEVFEREIIDEICSIFPDIDPETGRGYSAAARRTLKRYEAELLRAAGRAA